MSGGDADTVNDLRALVHARNHTCDSGALRATQSDEDRSRYTGLPALKRVYGRFGALRTGTDLTEERQPARGLLEHGKCEKRCGPVAVDVHVLARVREPLRMQAVDLGKNHVAGPLQDVDTFGVLDQVGVQPERENEANVRTKHDVGEYPGDEARNIR